MTERQIPDSRIERFSERLKKAMGEESMRGFARKIGQSDATLLSYLSGKTFPSLDRLAIIAERAGVDGEWLAFGSRRTESSEDEEEEIDEVWRPLYEGIKAAQKRRKAGEEEKLRESARRMEEFALVPRYNARAAAGYGLVATEEVVASYAFRRDWLLSRGLQGDKLALITAYGDSMEPDIHDGSMILVDLRQKAVEREGIYVLNVDGWLVAKIVQRDIDGTLYIRSRHPAYRELVVPKERVEDVIVIGRAVWTDRILS